MNQLIGRRYLNKTSFLNLEMKFAEAIGALGNMWANTGLIQSEPLHKCLIFCKYYHLANLHENLRGNAWEKKCSIHYELLYKPSDPHCKFIEKMCKTFARDCMNIHEYRFASLSGSLVYSNITLPSHSNLLDNGGPYPSNAILKRENIALLKIIMFNYLAKFLLSLEINYLTCLIYTKGYGIILSCCFCKSTWIKYQWAEQICNCSPSYESCSSRNQLFWT